MKIRVRRAVVVDKEGEARVYNGAAAAAEDRIQSWSDLGRTDLVERELDYLTRHGWALRWVEGEVETA